jgi:hypothetical protein
LGSPHPQQAQQFPSVSSVRNDWPTDELALRRLRIEELEELERRERALESRTREREALQRERDETLRSRVFDGYAGDALQNRTLPPHRPQFLVSQQSRPPALSLTSGRSYSTTSLLPPGPSTPATTAVQRAIKDVHLPDCQCPSCTVARYAETPLTARLRPQEREKSKGGWMRRLSMPVVSNAFSSEAKRAGGASGKGVNPKALGSLGEANRSLVSLGRR